MKELLKALRKSKLIAKGTDGKGHKVFHYLLLGGKKIIEVIQ